jgi:hypothetical protein
MEGREVVNVLGEVDPTNAGAGGVERLPDVAVDCGDNFLDRGNSFSLRAWPMPLKVPDIITIGLVGLWVAVFRCFMGGCSGEIPAGEVC